MTLPAAADAQPTTTAIRAGLELFLPHRYRAAFESAIDDGNDPVKARARDGYREVWTRAQSMLDAANLAVAHDLDLAEQIYIRAEEHPRRPSP